MSAPRIGSVEGCWFLPQENLEEESVNDALLRLGANEAARQLGISHRTLRRRLALRGTCLRSEVRRLRLDRSIRLLRSGVSVARAAREVGLASGESLARLLRRELGCSATEIREWQRGPE